MARDGLSATNQTASLASIVRPALFVAADFVSGFVRLWSGRGSKTVFGEEFLGVGTYGGISSIVESGEVSPRRVTFSLSGVSGALLATALGENYRGRDITAWLGFFADDLSTLLDDPYQIFRGRMDSMQIQESSGRILVQAESRLITLREPRTMRFSDAEQQRLFPGDLFCQFVAKMPDAAIIWGYPSPASGAATAPPPRAPGGHSPAPR